MGQLPVIVSTPSGRSTRGSHQLAGCATCERYWWLKYEQKWSPNKDKPYRLRGTLIHWCLAYLYASRMTPPPDWYHTQSLDATLDKEGRGHPADVLLAKQLLEAYQREYLQEPWTPFAIEEEFSAKIGEIDPIDADIEAARRQGLSHLVSQLTYLKTFDEEVITCRPDLLTYLPSVPCIDVFDYKSQGKNWDFADGRWVMRGGLERWKDDGEYALSWQVLVNLLILRAPSNSARLRHLPVRGFIIQRLTREPDRRGEFFFDRHLLKIPAGPYAQAPRALRMLVAKEYAIRENAKLGIRPAASFWACNTKYGACDFREVCMGQAPEDRERLLHELCTRDT